MKNLSLINRIILITSIPFLLYLALSLYLFTKDYKDYQSGLKFEKQLKLFSELSNEIHNLQKERGLTILSMESYKLRPQFEKIKETNLNTEKSILNHINEYELESSQIAFIEETIKELNSVRDASQVRGKEKEEIFISYSKVIKKFLSSYKSMIDKSHLAKISSKMKSIYILEEAKELGGKLREKSSGYLANMIKNDFFIKEELISFNAKYENLLTSDILDLDEDAQDKLQTLLNSNSFIDIRNRLMTSLKKQNEEKFDYSFEENYEIYTKLLDSLNEIILYEKNRTNGLLDEELSDSKSSLWEIAITLSLLSIVIILYGIWFLNKLKTQVGTISDSLSKNSKELLFSSESISSFSLKLSDSASESASSLQQTASAVEEINQMIERNLEASHKLKAKSELSIESANSGEAQISNVLTSINEVSLASQNIIEEVDKNNSKIISIIDLIELIEEKTKIINDIVFQTKLLSFNASVEAAKAGEHGRGFSVVAEEMGHLAEMSGKASKEIEEVLKTSVTKVKDYVHESKKNVGLVVGDAQNKIEKSSKMVLRSKELFKEILLQVNHVNDLVKEVSEASVEQASGVKQISEAMRELDHGTHSNSNVANETSSQAKNLQEQASNLDFSVLTLKETIFGSKTRQAS